MHPSHDGWKRERVGEWPTTSCRCYIFGFVLEGCDEIISLMRFTKKKGFDHIMLVRYYPSVVKISAGKSCYALKLDEWMDFSGLRATKIKG